MPRGLPRGFLRSTSVESFTAAEGSLPDWLTGLSMLATALFKGTRENPKG